MHKLKGAVFGTDLMHHFRIGSELTLQDMREIELHQNKQFQRGKTKAYQFRQVTHLCPIYAKVNTIMVMDVITYSCWD